MIPKRKDEFVEHDNHVSTHHSQHIHYHQCCDSHQQLERRPSGFASFLQGFFGGYFLMSIFSAIFGRKE